MRIQEAIPEQVISETPMGTMPCEDWETRVSQRAHELWLEDGCTEGKDLEHWVEAEQELMLKKYLSH